MSLWINLSVAFLVGILVYMLPSLLAPSFPAPIRMKIGEHYYKNSLRAYGKLAFVRRILGSYELHPIKVDDESKNAKVTFDSGVLSSSTDMPFKDPDDRIKRMYKKPVAVAIEQLPSAIDPELAEAGYWTREKHIEDSIEKTGVRQIQQEDGTMIEEEVTMIDPYVPVSPRRRVVDAIDSMAIVGKNTNPENIDTAKELTHRRYDEYGSGLDVAQTARMVTGFLAGAGGYIGVKYMQNSVMGSGGGGGGGTGIGIPTLMPVEAVQYTTEVILYVS